MIVNNRDWIEEHQGPTEDHPVVFWTPRCVESCFVLGGFVQFRSLISWFRNWYCRLRADEENQAAEGGMLHSTQQVGYICLSLCFPIAVRREGEGMLRRCSLLLWRCYFGRTTQRRE